MSAFAAKTDFVAGGTSGLKFYIAEAFACDLQVSRRSAM